MTDEVMTPLRRRMIEDMTMRRLAPKTRKDYIQIIKSLAAFLGRSLDTTSFEDIRHFQLHVAASGVGAGRSTATYRRYGSFSGSRSSDTPSSSTRISFMNLASCRWC